MPRLRSRVRVSFPAPDLKKGKLKASLFRQSPLFLTALFWCQNNRVNKLTGAIAKRLCNGLQIRLVQFDSGSRLQNLLLESTNYASDQSGAFSFEGGCKRGIIGFSRAFCVCRNIAVYGRSRCSAHTLRSLIHNNHFTRVTCNSLPWRTASD